MKTLTIILLLIPTLCSGQYTNAEKRVMDSIQAKRHRSLPLSLDKDNWNYFKSTGSPTQLKMKRKDGVLHIDGVEQRLVKYADGVEILTTNVWVKANLECVLTAYSPSNASTINTSRQTVYYVHQVSDSVIRAHRACADNFYLKKKYP